MANAVYDSVSVDIAAGEHTFRASASSLKFAGYTAVYEESRDDDKEEKEPALPELRPGEVVTLEGFEPGQHFTQPPARYTDATLIDLAQILAQLPVHGGQQPVHALDEGDPAAQVGIKRGKLHADDAPAHDDQGLIQGVAALQQLVGGHDPRQVQPRNRRAHRHGAGGDRSPP